MNILLSGASGFAGLHFTKEAISLGWNIVPLQSNLLEPRELTEEIQRAHFDVVVHMAAKSFAADPEPLDFYNINVLGTDNLLFALQTSMKAPSLVVLMSSAAVYGGGRSSPYSEEVYPDPTGHYALSKFAMEQVARGYSDSLNIVIVRPFNFTGIGQRESFIIPKLVNAWKRKERSIALGNLNVRREFNDVRFFCKSLAKIIASGVAGEAYNICSGVHYSLNDVIDCLTQITGHSAAVEINPKFLRRNDPYLICGDPQKLNGLIGGRVVSNYSLDETLTWMINHRE